MFIFMRAAPFPIHIFALSQIFFVLFENQIHRSISIEWTIENDSWIVSMTFVNLFHFYIHRWKKKQKNRKSQKYSWPFKSGSQSSLFFIHAVKKYRFNFRWKLEFPKCSIRPKTLNRNPNNVLCYQGFFYFSIL